VEGGTKISVTTEHSSTLLSSAGTSDCRISLIRQSDALAQAGRRDLAAELQFLHQGYPTFSSGGELPSTFPFLITLHKTMNYKEGLQEINCKYPQGPAVKI